MATRKYQGKKFEKDSVRSIEDALTLEEALQVNINGVPFTISMRTPGDDEALVRGLLHSEGVLTDVGYLPRMETIEEHDNKGVTLVDVTIPPTKLGKDFANSRSLLSVSSCGICGKTELEDLSSAGAAIKDGLTLDIGTLHTLFDQMNAHQSDFQQSGGTHAAAAFSLEGTLLAVMEDIGRHNAVDKVVGKLIASKQLDQAKIITVSGRISYEIVVKCFKARIPYLAAVSAPSSLAVDFAKELGITLFAFCRGERVTCYSHPNRVKRTLPEQKLIEKED
jgi:FdhD protein